MPDESYPSADAYVGVAELVFGIGEAQGKR